MKNFSTKDMVFTALFAAIFCILAPFSIPIGEVPVSVTNFLIYITIYAIGWKKATVSYIIYLLLGFVGLPVFAGFTGGISKLVSPTGGYLVGFIFTSVISGLIIEKFNYKRIPNIIGMIIGLAITYIWYNLACLWYGQNIYGSLSRWCITFPYFRLWKNNYSSYYWSRTSKTYEKSCLIGY